MLILPISSVTGAALGYLRGGRLRHLSQLELRASLLLAGALALQVGAGRAPEAWRFPITVASYGTVAAWLVVNASGRPGRLRLAVGLLAAGWALNLAAIAVNGGMPVSLRAARDVGARPHFDVTQGNLSKHVPASGETHLSWLGDVIPLSPVASVISVGDVAMFAGIVLAVAFGMAPPTAADRPAQEAAEAEPAVGGHADPSSAAVSCRARAKRRAGRTRAGAGERRLR